MAEKPGTTKDKAAAAAKAEPKKRTILTAAERIAKMEADLAAERTKVADKTRKQMVALEEKSKALVARRDKINEEIKTLGEQHVELSKLLPEEETSEDAPTES